MRIPVATHVKRQQSLAKEALHKDGPHNVGGIRLSEYQAKHCESGPSGLGLAIHLLLWVLIEPSFIFPWFPNRWLLLLRRGWLPFVACRDKDRSRPSS